MRPPAETLVWCERTLGRGARVVGCRRLTGGLTSAVHRLTIEHRGQRRSFVLRRWVPGQLDDYAPRAIASEIAALTALAGADVPAPRLVGATGDAVLMTCLPGRIDLAPRDLDRWLRQMARMLVRIHDLDLDAKPFESWLEPGKLAPPADARRPDRWRAA